MNLTAGGRFAVVMAWLLGVGGIALSVWLYAQATRARAVQTGALTASGQVVRLGATRGDHPKWVATYAYQAAGESYEGRSTLGRRDRQPLAVGDALQVRYLPNEPARSWVDGYQPDRVPLLLAPLAFVSLGLSAGAIAFTLRRQRTMLTSGRPAVATVKDVKKTSHQHGESYTATVEYETLTGSRITRTLGVSKGIAAGSRLIVLYDPDTPTRAVKYPLSMVRPAAW